MKITECSLVGFVLAIGCCVTIANADTLRTVALSGDAAPDTNVDFASFRAPVLNNAGQTAFFAYLNHSSVGNNNDSSIWSEGGGSLALVARTSGEAPGTSGKFSGFREPLLNNIGQVAFIGIFSDSGENGSDGSAIWSEGSGSLALVARSENGTPDISTDFSWFALPVFNDAGETAFLGFLSGEGVNLSNDRSIWSESDGFLTMIVREGVYSPRVGGVLSTFSNPVLNGSGQLAIIGRFKGAEFGVRSIWLETEGTLAQVARTGSEAMGTNQQFKFLTDLSINDAGQTAFRAGITGGIGKDRGIWSGESGSLALVARKGDVAPGTSTFFSGFDSPTLNGSGQTAFAGKLSDSLGDRNRNSGIWSEAGGSLRLIAREGDEAPGTNALFSGFMFSPALNGAGQTAFSGHLRGEGVNSRNDEGIWAQDPSGELKLIVREGDMLDVDDGLSTDFRIIRRLDTVAVTGNEDGRASVFNDIGQLVFRATFTDGTSGIFVSSLVAVPEPSSLLLLGVAGVCLTLRYRHT